jgi:hypothetical protein
LISLTNNLGFIELFQEFVEFLIEKRVNTPIVFQDCSAVVTSVTKGEVSREPSTFVLA